MSLLLRINKSLWASGGSSNSSSSSSGSNTNSNTSTTKNDNDNDDDDDSNKITYEEDDVITFPHNVNRPLIYKFKIDNKDNNTMGGLSSSSSSSTSSSSSSATTTTTTTTTAAATTTVSSVSLIDPYLQTEVFLKYISSLLSSLSIEQQNSFVEYDNILTPLSYMTYNDIACNISSLRVERIQRIMRPYILKLMQHNKNGNIFNDPVDPVALGTTAATTTITTTTTTNTTTATTTATTTTTITTTITTTTTTLT